MSVKEGKKGTGRAWRQAEPNESRNLLVIVLVSAVIVFCSVWHLCRQKDNEPYFKNTVLVEHIVVFDTLMVNVSIGQSEEFSPSEVVSSNERDE